MSRLENKLEFPKADSTSNETSENDNLISKKVTPGKNHPDKDTSCRSKQTESDRVKLESQSQRGNGEEVQVGGNYSHRIRNPPSISGDKDRDPSLIRLDEERFRTGHYRALNYGSMERSKRSEHKNLHLERRLSYGSGPQNVHEQTNGRTSNFNCASKSSVHTGSLERERNLKATTTNMSYECGPLKRESMPSLDYGRFANISKAEELRQEGSAHSDNHSKNSKFKEPGNKQTGSADKVNDDLKEYRYPSSKTDSTNRTSYYSHVSRLERLANQSEGTVPAPAIRRSSYDFQRSQEKSERNLNYGYKADSQEKCSLLEIGKDRRRLSQPPAGGPPPFYHPPPPPGKLIHRIFSFVNFVRAKKKRRLALNRFKERLLTALSYKFPFDVCSFR